MDTQGSIVIVTWSGRDQDGLAGERDAAPARAPATLADLEETTSAWVHWSNPSDSCTGSVVSHRPKPKPTIALRPSLPVRPDIQLRCVSKPGRFIDNAPLSLLERHRAAMTGKMGS